MAIGQFMPSMPYDNTGKTSPSAYWQVGTRYWDTWQNNLEIMALANHGKTAYAKQEPTSLSGSGLFSGLVNAPSGMTYFIPHNYTQIGILAPSGSFIFLPSTVDISDLAKWRGGVLGRDGKIYCAPYDAPDVLVIDPGAGINFTTSRTDFGLSLTGSGKYYGGTMDADGKIWFAPHNATKFLVIDTAATPVTANFVTPLPSSPLESMMTEDNKWCGAVCNPDGIIYLVPHNANVVGKIVNGEFENVPTFQSNAITEKFCGGTVTIDGNVIFGARSSEIHFIIFRDGTTIEVSADGVGSANGILKWTGITSGPDGNIYLCPGNDKSLVTLDRTFAPVSAAVPSGSYSNGQGYDGFIWSQNRLNAAMFENTNLFFVAPTTPTYWTNVDQTPDARLSPYFNN